MTDTYTDLLKKHQEKKERISEDVADLPVPKSGKAKDWKWLGDDSRTATLTRRKSRILAPYAILTERLREADTYYVGIRVRDEWMWTDEQFGDRLSAARRICEFADQRVKYEDGEALE